MRGLLMGYGPRSVNTGPRLADEFAHLEAFPPGELPRDRL